MINLEEVGKGHPAECMYLQQLYELVIEVNAQLVLEIGSGKFTFSRAILKGLEETGGHLHTCDPIIVPTYTHDRMTFYPVPSDKLAQSWDGDIDFLLIDGDHSAPQVTKDYYNFKRFVRAGGLIALHDINVPHAAGVKKLWSHIKESTPVRLEITSWPGFGVIHV